MHALPAVEEADELVAVGALALADHGPHHRVEPGAVAAAGQHRHSHVRASSVPVVGRPTGATAIAFCAPMSVVIAIDAGTTGVRAFAFDDDGTRGRRSRTASSPSTSPSRAGSSTTPTRSGRAVADHRSASWSAALDEPVAAIGITDQRETVVAWDRRTGAARCTGPSSGRTAAPPPAATTRATPGT